MSLEEKVQSLMDCTGLAAKVAADVINRRQAKWNEAAAKKKAATAKFEGDRARVQKLLAADELASNAATKAAELAMNTEIKHREEFSTIHDTMTAATNSLDPILRQHADPAIAALIDEFIALRAAAPALHRASAGGGDNGAAVVARIRALDAAIEAAQRLQIDPDATDVASAIDQLRKSIPGA